MDNPYQTPSLPSSVHVQRTVMQDPTGSLVTLSELRERTILLPDGQRVTEVTTLLPQTAEGVLLTEPRVVYRCGSCGSQPLLVVHRCSQCGRATCTPCVTLADDAVVCRSCAQQPRWVHLLKLLGAIGSWLRPR